MASVTWNGREVRNPILRVLVAIFAIGVLVLLIPPSLPFHIVIRALGGRGFTDGTGSYTVPNWCSLIIVAGYIVLLVVIL